MDRNSFYDKDVLDYIRKSECDYKDEEFAGVCCPLAHSLLKNGTTHQIEPPKQLDNIKTDKLDNIKSKSGSNDRVQDKALLPTPGEETGQCGAQSLASRIINGKEADVLEFPWMALLNYGTDDSPWKCGGSLIHPRYVLSAAHCFTNKNFKL